MTLIANVPVQYLEYQRENANAEGEYKYNGLLSNTTPE